MLKCKTSCAVLANLSSNLLNEVGLSLFRYFEVGLRVCDIVVNKYVRYLISWWVLVRPIQHVLWKHTKTEQNRVKEHGMNRSHSDTYELAYSILYADATRRGGGTVWTMKWGTGEPPHYTECPHIQKWGTRARLSPRFRRLCLHVAEVSIYTNSWTRNKCRFSPTL